MTFHSSVLIFELLNLFFIANEDTYLSIEDLNASFNILVNITNRKENTSLSFNFTKEWTKFLESYSELLDIEEDYIKDVNLDSLYHKITQNTKYLTTIDTEITTYVHNMEIYKILNIPIPIQETSTIFTINGDIITTLFNLAKFEINGKPLKDPLNYLKKLKDLLIDKLQELDSESDIVNLKMALTYYDSFNTFKSNSPYAIFGWYTLLFEPNTISLSKLSYEIIKYATPFIEEWINTPEEERNENIEENYSAFEIFLSTYLFNILKYIDNCPIKSLKENLIYQKYLLLALPELKDAYNLLLQEESLINYKPLPNFENFTFGGFFPTTLNVIFSLKYSDYEILNNEELYFYTITRLIFIKTYLSLATNITDLKLIEELITIRFQANPNFKITNDLIENIILREISGHQKER